MNDGHLVSENRSELSFGKASSNEEQGLSPPSNTRFEKTSSARTITFQPLRNYIIAVLEGETRLKLGCFRLARHSLFSD